MQAEDYKVLKTLQVLYMEDDPELREEVAIFLRCLVGDPAGGRTRRAWLETLPGAAAGGNYSEENKGRFRGDNRHSVAERGNAHTRPLPP